jgi:hypothetical protein
MEERDEPGNVNGGLVERRVDRVDWNRVVGVGRVATDIDDDAKSALVADLSNRFRRDERGDLAREVDAVDKDVDCVSAG